MVGGEGSLEVAHCRFIGPGGTAIIAKGCEAADAQIERVVYEHYLARLPLTTARYYGSVESGGLTWMFLGELRGEEYSYFLAQHRVYAAQWLGTLHSGAQAVVEGVGDHGCEYMTGGTVVVLGVTGRNFAAGMSGGIAYVLDADGEFAKYCNASMVDIEPLLSESEQRARLPQRFWHLGQSDEALARSLIEKHRRYTNSQRAKEILENWGEYRERFVKVFPKEYRRALGELGPAPQKAA